MQLADQLNKNFISEGVKCSTKLRRNITNFVMMRKAFLVHKRLGSKRLSEENLEFRIHTIKRVLEQQKKDRNLFGVSYQNDLIKTQILIALLEKACLLEERHNKQDARDTLAFDFHLWVFVKQLKEQNINKPVEVLSLVFQNSGVYSGMASGLSLGTIRNKLTKIQRLVDASKALGACHEPITMGHSHRVNASSFLRELSTGCQICQEKWIQLLGIKVSSKLSLEVSRSYLLKKTPTAKEVIQSVCESLVSKNSGMPLVDIIEKFPEKSKIMLEEIFTE